MHELADKSDNFEKTEKNEKCSVELFRVAAEISSVGLCFPRIIGHPMRDVVVKDDGMRDGVKTPERFVEGCGVV